MQNGHYCKSPIIGDSPNIDRVRAQIAYFAQTHSPILIEGETGTGKALVVTALVNTIGPSLPLSTLNCSGLHAQYLEKELFGSRNSTDPNSNPSSPGKSLLDKAQGGIIVLDEISQMPLPTQLRLLKLLQDRTYQKNGSKHTVSSNLQCIATSSQSLRDLTQQGIFRSDLYHRLSTLYIHLAPLRERRSDIPLLIDYFQSLYIKDEHRFVLSAEAYRLLENNSFPGNVRDLKNLIIHIATQKLTGTVHAEKISTLLNQLDRQTKHREVPHFDSHLSENPMKRLEPIQARAPSPRLDFSLLNKLMDCGAFNLNHYIQDIEQLCIKVALQRNAQSISAAAKELNLNRSTLHNRLKRYAKHGGASCI